MIINNRIYSLDIMRGLTLLLMLFVSDLNLNVVPKWLGFPPFLDDGMGLANWLIPSFLFIAGMAVPFAITKRFTDGQSLYDISRNICLRSMSLLIIGVLMINTERVNPEMTGLSKNLWAILMYLAIFLYWNVYPDKENKFFTSTGLKLLSLSIFVFLVFKFKSGLSENNGSLITGNWGILGQLGWGYLVAAFTFILCRDSILKTSLITFFFLLLNILSDLKVLEFLNPVKPAFATIIEGHVPFILLSGLVGGLIIKKTQGRESKSVILTFLCLGLIYLAGGFILRKCFIISQIQATSGWGMICTGVSFLVFISLYRLASTGNKLKWAAFVKPAGENSLTTYLISYILSYLISSSGIPLLIYKQSGEPYIVIAGSIAWALIIVMLAAIVKRLNISLKI